MDARPYTLKDRRRAAEERRKAAVALTEEARRMHLDLAEIFEARAGLSPATADGSNVIALRPKSARERRARAAAGAAASEASAGAAGSRRRPARSRATGSAAPRAG